MSVDDFHSDFACVSMAVVSLTMEHGQTGQGCSWVLTTLPGDGDRFWFEVGVEKVNR